MKNYLLALGVLAAASWPGGAVAQTLPTSQEIGNLVVSNIPALPADLMARVDQYQNVRTASVADWDRDGKGLFIATRFADVPQIHYVAAPGADRQQITFYKEPLTEVAVAPDKRQNGFLFSRDNGGDENYQLYFFDLGTGQARLLTDGKSRNQFPGLEPGRLAARLYEQPAQRRRPRPVPARFSGRCARPSPHAPRRAARAAAGAWRAWSDDAKQMILGNYKSINETELFRFDVATRKLERLHPTKEPVSYGSVAFAQDGKGLFWLSDEGTEFRTLRYYDFATQQQTPLTATIPWDVADMQLSQDGARLVFTTNEGGYSKLYVLDTHSRQYQAVARTFRRASSVAMTLNDDGRRLALTL